MPDIPLHDSTEHLDFHVEDGRFLCAGSIREYERFYQYVGDQLDLELASRVPVYFVDGAAEFCGKGLRGCRKPDGVVFASVGTVRHELVHAASCERRSSSAPLLVEGLATSFEPRPLIAKADVSEVITTLRGDLTSWDYDESGHFVRWLLQEYEIESFWHAYDFSPRGGGDDVVAVLESTFGADIDALMTEYLASAPHLWVPHRQCADLPLLEPVDGVWTFEAVFDCEDPSTSGPYERVATQLVHLYESLMYQSVRIEVDTPGTVQFARDEIETELRIERCLDAEGLSEEQADQLWHKEGLFPSLQGTTDVELTPGTYRVDVLRPHGPPHPVAVTIAPLAG